MELGVDRVRIVDRGVGAVAQKEPVQDAVGRVVVADDLAGRVDPDGMVWVAFG